MRQGEAARRLHEGSKIWRKLRKLWKRKELDIADLKGALCDRKVVATPLCDRSVQEWRQFRF